MKKFKQWKMSSKILVPTAAVLVLFVASIGIQFAANMSIAAIPSSPEEDFDAGGADRLLYYFDLDRSGRTAELDALGVELTDDFIEEQLAGSYRYIDGRYDCADFRVNMLVRLYLSYPEYLSADELARAKECLLGFKYWMDEGGEDSMCAWSENHQILFAASEYLVGQAFPNETFDVDGKTGAWHQSYAEERINAWLGLRFSYGFSEWYSSNYYPEDIAPLANLIQFAEDDDLVTRAKIVMDILWYDLATQSFKYDGVDADGVSPRTYYIFNAASGRMYSDNRMSDDTGNRLRRFTDFVLQPLATQNFTDSWYTSSNGFFNCFKQMYQAETDAHEPFYEVPQVIQDIFNDPAEEKVIKSTQSLDVEELAGKNLIGQDARQIMFQWGMEAFTNPEVIDNTIRYISRNKMFSNEFLNDFKMVNLWPFTLTKTLKAVSNMLHPATDGIAIERGNIYSYKTDRYSMSTAQAYQTGEFADQHAIGGVNLSNEVSVFTSQPAKIARRSGTPTYWVGNGRQPYSVQEKNVNLTIYQPPTKTGMMEPMILENTTHVFFPTQLFEEYDESRLDEGYIFGCENDSYIAIKAGNPLVFKSFDESNDTANGTNKDDMLKRGSVGNVLTEKYDLVQTGEGFHYYVTEVSSVDAENFEDFKTRFIANVGSSVMFNQEDGSLTYSSQLNGGVTQTALHARYDDWFKVNGVEQNLQYARYENAYVPNGVTARDPSTIVYSFGGHTASLNLLLTQRTL